MKLTNLKTKYLGRDFIFYNQIDSTQNEIFRRIENNNIKNNCKGMRYLSFLHANAILLKRQCFRLFLNSGQLKNLFHALPLLIRGSTRFTLLEFVYKGFPFGLPLQCRQSAESTVPVKVGRSFHNHKQTVSQ